VVKSRDQIITSVDHDDRYFNKSVTKIFVDSQIVNFMPVRIDKFMPNIKEVQIINSSLKAIDKFDLKAFRQLEFLNLPFNHLEELKNDLFVFVPKLRYAYFNNNRLKVIGDRLFDTLENTNFLASFEFNVCIHFFFQNREVTKNTSFADFHSAVRNRCEDEEVSLNFG
jgi:Leucine-rich repeat (LRR) protein